MSDYACKVCKNEPDADGDLKHGKGCYVVSAEGGGTSYVEEADSNRRERERTRVAAPPHVMPPRDALFLASGYIMGLSSLIPGGSRPADREMIDTLRASGAAVDEGESLQLALMRDVARRAAPVDGEPDAPETDEREQDTRVTLRQQLTEAEEAYRALRGDFEELERKHLQLGISGGAASMRFAGELREILDLRP